MNKKIIILLIIIVALVLGLGIGSYFLLVHKEQSKDDKSNYEIQNNELKQINNNVSIDDIQ